MRTLVKFAVPVWSPYTKADINTIEKVQRRATKIPTALANMEYSLRCKTMGLLQPQDGMRSGDLISRFKIERDFEEVNWYVGGRHAHGQDILP